MRLINHYPRLWVLGKVRGTALVPFQIVGTKATVVAALEMANVRLANRMCRCEVPLQRAFKDAAEFAAVYLAHVWLLTRVQGPVLLQLS